MSAELRFVRVVHRQGWDVEFIDAGRTENYPTREEALAAAQAASPAWIEIGEIVPASGSSPQHHAWTTLRRAADGGYRASGLSWHGDSAR